MSIEWSRIEPEQGCWDQAALDHYRDLLDRLTARGIRVFVTLHHCTHPLWFERLGGFAKADNRGLFERYLSFLVPKIAASVSGWNVINEFNHWGGLAAGPEVAAIRFAMLRVHALGYHLIRRHSAAPVSSAHAYVHYMPRRCHDPLDLQLAERADWTTNEFFFHALRTGELVFPGAEAEYDPEVKGAFDCWAINYYTRRLIDGRRADLKGQPFRHKRLRLIPMDFYLEEMYPEGLIAAVERLSDRPLFITENGCAADDDRFRIVYLALHLSALHEAMDGGANVRGYFHWSLLDNYEWTSFVPRFGLVAVDRATFARTPKPSAWFYREVIDANGFDGATVRRHLDALPTLERRPS